MGTENIRLPGEEAEQVPELPVEVKTISSYEPPRFEVQEGGMLIDGKAVSGIKVESLNPADLASSPDGGTIVLQQQRKEENNPWKVIRRDSSGAYAKQFELEQFMKDEFLRNGNVFGVTVNRPGEKSKENTYTVHLNEKEIGIGEDYPQFNERITGDVTQYQVVSRQNHDRRSIHFFDSANPEHEFPRCEVVGRGQGHGEFSVNGVQWHVPGEVDYSSGYRVLADKYSNDIALNTRARSGGKSAIVHNNKTWKHAFENAYGMRLEAGYLSLVDRHHDDKKLYINDNVWQMPDFEKKNAPQSGSIEDYYVSKNGHVAAAVSVYDEQAGWHNKVLTGDTKGATSKWDKPVQGHVEKVVTNDDGTSVAVLTNLEEGKRVVLIDGIEYPLNNDINEVADFNLADKVLLLSYRTADGRFVKQEVTLKENAAEVVARRQEQETKAAAVRELVEFMLTGNLKPEDVLAQAKKVPSLEATIKSQGNSLKVEQEENVKFRKEVDNLTLAIKEKESAMMSKQNAIEDLQSKAKQIKSLLEGATKKFAGGYDINKEELVKLLDNIIKGG